MVVKKSGYKNMLIPDETFSLLRYVRWNLSSYFTSLNNQMHVWFWPVQVSFLQLLGLAVKHEGGTSSANTFLDVYVCYMYSSLPLSSYKSANMIFLLLKKINHALIISIIVQNKQF